MSPVTEARSETRGIGIGACRLDSSADVGAKVGQPCTARAKRVSTGMRAINTW
jgi:hypothetical protein